MLAGEDLGPVPAGLWRAGHEDAARPGGVRTGALQWRTDHLPWWGRTQVRPAQTDSETVQSIDVFRSRAGEFIGAIGVSGGTVEADLEIARAAAAAVAAL